MCEWDAPLKTKVCMGCFCLSMLALGIFIFVRTVIMDCGCPAGYEDDTPCTGGDCSSSCGCEGGIFDCKYQCYDGLCFEDGSETSCDGSTFNNTPSETSDDPDPSAGAPSGSVTCPGKMSYCDCDADCGGTYCDCDPAWDLTCCGSLSE